MVDVDDLGDWVEAGGKVWTMTDRYMEGMRATDGTDIGNRTRRRDYMKALGVADSSDFSPEFKAKARASVERDKAKARREYIARTVYTKIR